MYRRWILSLELESRSSTLDVDSTTDERTGWQQLQLFPVIGVTCAVHKYISMSMLRLTALQDILLQPLAMCWQTANLDVQVCCCPAALLRVCVSCLIIAVWHVMCW